MEALEQIPTESELVLQAKLLCREFMYSRITREGLSWCRVEAAPPAAPAALTHAALVLLKLGDELENMRPNVYRNIAKQLNISVTMEAVVSDAFLYVATEILSLGITWGKVVAIFAVAGGLAVDCVRQERAAVVHTIEESLGEFVRKSLVPWLRRRGGWGDILKCVRNVENRTQTHWTSSVILTWRHLLNMIYIYLIK
ncbi:bcl-2-related ovarian killer protein homolog B isoform X1 [Ictalurus punctatus]|uniref:Bcl-2-related ovarian killer protein homolog B isoform X1 n=1 Tax=Ictalurus punctatus TaxID=7998 RepID=A0A9F7RU92_ICTPU|nr:bcl-2-related ovarian killer protein homolog B isoform X1 [Ictalurus punctatus]